MQKPSCPLLLSSRQVALRPQLEHLPLPSLTCHPLFRLTPPPPPPGMKSRGVYETPGGTILLTARRAMESITLDRGEAHLKVGLVGCLCCWGCVEAS
jgi:hypothetical protein